MRFGLEEHIIDILMSLVLMLVAWNVYLFKTIHAVRTALFELKLHTTETFQTKQQTQTETKDITERIVGLERRIENQITFLLQERSKTWPELKT